MTIEPYAAVATRMTNTLADQIRVNRRNHVYPDCKQWDDLVERQYKLEPNKEALELLKEYPSMIGDVVLNHTFLIVIEEKSGNAAKSIIPYFIQTFLQRNVSWDIRKLQSSVETPAQETRAMTKEGLLNETTLGVVNHHGPAIAVELFSDYPNMLRYDVRAALAVDLTGIFPDGSEYDYNVIEQIASYLDGTGFDINLDWGERKIGPKKYMINEEWSKAGIDSITKYTIGVTVSFDDSDLIAHELCIDIFADDVNFAIKKAVKLLHSYCRDNVQVIRTRVICEKRYIAQDTDMEEELS